MNGRDCWYTPPCASSHHFLFIQKEIYGEFVHPIPHPAERIPCRLLAKKLRSNWGCLAQVAFYLLLLSLEILLNMKNLLFLASLFLLLTAFTLPKLVRTKITKQITLSIPKNFTVMPDEGIAMKYPAQRKPLAVYTSPNGQVDVSVSQRPSSFRKSDMPMLRDFYKASILSMYSDVAFIREEITTINKQDFIVFEFVSTVKDERQSSNLAPIRRYTIAQYTILDNNLTVFTFNVPFLLQRDWQETAQKVMASVRVKG